MKETWANILQTRMEGYKEPAPEGLWEGIEAGLAATAVTATAAIAAKGLVHAKHLTHLKWFLGVPVATAAAVTAIVVGYKALFNKPTTPQPQTPVEIVQQPKADTTEQVAPAQPAPIVAKPAQVDTDVVNAPVQTPEPKVEVSQPEPKKEPAKEPEVDNSGETAKQWTAYLAKTEKHRVKKTISVGAFLGGLSGSVTSADPNAGIKELAYLGLPWYPGTTSITEPLFSNTEYHHKIPIHIGLMFRCDFGNTFGLSTGAVYSILASDITSGSSQANIDGHQLLQFVGVPLNLNFNIYNSNAFSVYATTGVMAEKCVKGQIKRNIFYNGKQTGTYVENLTVNPLYWSVNAAAGIKFNLIKGFGLYAEPGVGYHIDNNSSVKSLYSDMPVEFNLSLGVIYTFPSR